MEKHDGSERQLLAALGPLLSMLTVGLTLGFNTVQLIQLTSVANESGTEVRITSEGEAHLLFSASSFPMLLGCLLSPILAETVGRRRSLMTIYPVSLIGWASIGLARDISSIAIGRAIHGLAAGLFTPLHRRDSGSEVQERVPHPDRRGNSIRSSNRRPPPRLLLTLENDRSRLLGRHVPRLPRNPRVSGEPRLADEQGSSGSVAPMDLPWRMGVGDGRVSRRVETKCAGRDEDEQARISSVVQTLLVPAPRIQRLVLRLSILRIKLGRRSRRPSPRGNVQHGRRSLRHFDRARAEIDHERARLPPDNQIREEEFDLQLRIGHRVFSVRLVAHHPFRLTLVMVEGYLLARLFRLVGDRSVTCPMDPHRRIVLGQVEKFRDRPRAGPLVSLLHRGHDRAAGIGGQDQGAGSLCNLQSVGDSRGCTLGPRVIRGQEERGSAEDRRNVRR